MRAGCCGAHVRWVAAMPPPTYRVMPWILVAASRARNSTGVGDVVGLDHDASGGGGGHSVENGAGRLVAGVRGTPGATVLTRTPPGPYSADQAGVSCSSAALVAVYMAANGLPTRASHEPMSMMTPFPR
jgi:hypothetical protein